MTKLVFREQLKVEAQTLQSNSEAAPIEPEAEVLRTIVPASAGGDGTITAVSPGNQLGGGGDSGNVTLWWEGIDATLAGTPMLSNTPLTSIGRTNLAVANVAYVRNAIRSFAAPPGTSPTLTNPIPVDGQLWLDTSAGGNAVTLNAFWNGAFRPVGGAQGDFLPLAGGVMGGQITLPGSAQAGTNQAPGMAQVQQMIDQAGLGGPGEINLDAYLLRAGGQMTGQLSTTMTSFAGAQMPTAEWVTAQIAAIPPTDVSGLMPRAGGQFVGNVTMGAGASLSLSSNASGWQAVPFSQMDSILQGYATSEQLGNYMPKSGGAFTNQVTTNQTTFSDGQLPSAAWINEQITAALAGFSTGGHGVSPKDWGAIADGAPHPLSSITTFQGAAAPTTLAGWQAVFGNWVSSLAQEIDQAALHKAVLEAAAAGTYVRLEGGRYQCNFAPEIPVTTSVAVIGEGPGVSRLEVLNNLATALKLDVTNQGNNIHQILFSQFSVYSTLITEPTPTMGGQGIIVSGDALNAWRPRVFFKNMVFGREVSAIVGVGSLYRAVLLYCVTDSWFADCTFHTEGWNRGHGVVSQGTGNWLPGMGHSGTLGWYTFGPNMVNCYFSNLFNAVVVGDGLGTAWTQGCKLVQCLFNYCVHGIVWRAQNTQNSGNDYLGVTQCDFNCIGASIWTDTVSGLQYCNNYFIGNVGQSEGSVKIENAAGANVFGIISGNNFSGFWQDNNGGLAIHHDLQQSLTVRGNYFFNFNASSFSISLAAAVVGITFEGNLFQDCANPPIDASGQNFWHYNSAKNGYTYCGTALSGYPDAAAHFGQVTSDQPLRLSTKNTWLPLSLEQNSDYPNIISYSYHNDLHATWWAGNWQGDFYITPAATAGTPAMVVRSDGRLSVNADPVDPNDVVTKRYLEAHAGSVSGDYLPLSGGTVQGDVTVRHDAINAGIVSITPLSAHAALDVNSQAQISSSLFLSSASGSGSGSTSNMYLMTNIYGRPDNFAILGLGSSINYLSTTGGQAQLVPAMCYGLRHTVAPQPTTTVAVTLASPSNTITVTNGANFKYIYAHNVKVGDNFYLCIGISGNTFTFLTPVSVADATAGRTVIGKNNPEIWGGNFGYWDHTGLPSSQTNTGQVFELDYFCNAADDDGALQYGVPRGNRTVVSIIMGKDDQNGVDAEVSDVLSLYTDGGTSFKRGLAASLAKWSQAFIDTRYGTQLAGANTIWLKQGQSIAFDEPGTAKMSFDGTIEFTAPLGIHTAYLLPLTVDNTTGPSLISFAGTGGGGSAWWAGNWGDFRIWNQTANSGAIFTLSGDLILVNNGAQSTVATQSWVLTEIGNAITGDTPGEGLFLPIVGGTLSGPLTIETAYMLPLALVNTAADPCIISYAASGYPVWWAGNWQGDFWITLAASSPPAIAAQPDGSVNIGLNLGVRGSLGLHPMGGGIQNYHMIGALGPKTGMIWSQCIADAATWPNDAQRTHYWVTDLGPSVDCDRTWVKTYSNLVVSGPGKLAFPGHIVSVQCNVDTRPGGSVDWAIASEHSSTSTGHIHFFSAVLSLPRNYGGTGYEWTGIDCRMEQSNPAAGAIENYIAINNKPPGGTGPRPTKTWFIRNEDAQAPLNSLGPIVAGSTTANDGNALQVIGSRLTINTSLWNAAIITNTADGPAMIEYDTGGKSWWAGNWGGEFRVIDNTTGAPVYALQVKSDGTVQLGANPANAMDAATRGWVLTEIGNAITGGTPGEEVYLPLIGGTLAGQLKINANSWIPLEVHNTGDGPSLISYVNTHIWRAGAWGDEFWIRDEQGTGSFDYALSCKSDGRVTLGADPSGDMDAATKRWVLANAGSGPGTGGGLTQEQADLRYLRLTGGDLTGALHIASGEYIALALRGTGNNNTDPCLIGYQSNNTDWWAGNWGGNFWIRSVTNNRTPIQAVGNGQVIIGDAADGVWNILRLAQNPYEQPCLIEYSVANNGIWVAGNWMGDFWIAVAGQYTPALAARADGRVTLGAAPTQAMDAATKGYVDTLVDGVPVAFAFSGKPPAGAKLNVPITRAVTVAAALNGSRGYASVFASASSAFVLNKISGGTTTALGSISFTAGGAISFSGSGGSLAVGDVLQLVAPTPADAALADPGITIHCGRA